MHRLKRQEYLLAWSAAWLLMSLHFAAGALSALIGRNPWDRRFLELSEFLIALSALAFYSAARSYAGLKVPVRALAVATVVFAAWPAVHVNQHLEHPADRAGRRIHPFAGRIHFLQEGRRQEARADVLLAVAFTGWGLLYLSAAFRAFLPFMQRDGLLPLMVLPQLFTCLLMVMAVYEEERRRVERNMLALSSLNLATSSFAGGEIQKTAGAGARARAERRAHSRWRALPATRARPPAPAVGDRRRARTIHSAPPSRNPNSTHTL